MERFSYYHLSGSPWDEVEDKLLTKEYQIESKDIIEIGKLHRRTPGGIAYRLKVLNLTEMQTTARGYTAYLNSDLYREIVRSGEERRKKKQLEKSNENLIIRVNIEEEFKNAGAPWSGPENEQLFNEYSQLNLSLLEICKIHKRLPGGILRRLKDLHLLTGKNNTARGYKEYLESDLYKQLKFLKTKSKKEDIPSITVSKPTITLPNSNNKESLEKQIKDLKSDITEIKNSIQEIKDILQSKKIVPIERNIVNTILKNNLVNRIKQDNYL